MEKDKNGIEHGGRGGFRGLPWLKEAMSQLFGSSF